MNVDFESIYSDRERVSIESCFPFDIKSQDAVDTLCLNIYNINKNYEYFEYQDSSNCNDFRNFNIKIKNINENLQKYLNPLGLYISYVYLLNIDTLNNLHKKSKLSIPTIVRYSKFLKNF